MGVWRNPHFHPLGNKGVGQIIIDAGVQWRVLGFHSDDRTEFTVVLVCRHDGPKYYPADSKATAESRMIAIKNGSAMRLLCDPPS